MVNFLHREVFVTEDGSTTFKLQDATEQFHSIHGAINESLHIYIQQGLQYRSLLPNITLLEVGFGTGLNAILTFIHAAHQSIRYDAIENYPLSTKEVAQLNYSQLLPNFPTKVFETMHLAKSSQAIMLTDSFQFRKILKKIEDIELSKNYYDLVYYDMFNPDLQPELWSENIFSKIYSAIKPNGFLITYCAKGCVKRTLKNVGFSLEALPGPASKREITRATKLL